MWHLSTNTSVFEGSCHKMYFLRNVKEIKKTSSVLSSSNSSDDCSLGEKPECKVNKPDSGRVTLSETDTSYRFTDCAEDQCVRQNIIMMLDFFFF